MTTDIITNHIPERWRKYLNAVIPICEYGVKEEEVIECSALEEACDELNFRNCKLYKYLKKCETFVCGKEGDR